MMFCAKRYQIVFAVVLRYSKRNYVMDMDILCGSAKSAKLRFAKISLFHFPEISAIPL
jgi:hypothetical protein